MIKYILPVIFCLSCISLSAQSDRWQQKVKYEMEIDMDVKSHTYKGKQKIKYWNNSPDTLHKVFYHLYFNAFQPNSMMDVRSLTISDPDRRVSNRISQLKQDEIGYQKVSSLKQDGNQTQFHTEGTILEVTLAKPILPGKTTNLEMEWTAQVPIQIRRSGRDSAEGISYSMSQWYPKLCEYDYQGWHANPYVGREFYGIWGDFEVTIKIDRKYTVGATGVLQNMEDMGHGYSDKNTKKKGIFRKNYLTWTFKAENVHDFVWGADPDYTHYSKKTSSGTTLHYFYQENDKTRDNWTKLHEAMDVAEQYMNKHFGKYPYPVYAFIQGGDGGMEYPMATLITGERNFTSLVGVSVHEWMHSWYQMLLGTNEALYAWMDEGFTSWGSASVMNHLKKAGILEGDPTDNPHYNSVRGYARFAKSGSEEPLSTHADHFESNTAYGVGSYTKGLVFLEQLEYIMGKKSLDRTLLRYYNEWAFKHPNLNDFLRVAEKVSGLELDWFKEYWVNTTHTIDYGIGGITESDGITSIELKKVGVLPMPIDIVISLKDGSELKYCIPLRMMRGEKQDDVFEGDILTDWPWTHQSYMISENISAANILKVEIDPSGRLADVELSNNVWPQEKKDSEEN